MNPSGSKRRGHGTYVSDDALTVETQHQMFGPRTPVHASEPSRRLHDPSGLTTGRWTVRRVVLAMVGGRAAVWQWRAAPEAARGVKAQVLWKYHRDFRTHAAALIYANTKARENLR